MFNYEIINLSSDEVETRRKVLDHAGLQAYLFPIGLLFTIWAYRKLTASQSKLNASKKPSAAEKISRRISWILDTTYISEFGPLQVQILGLLYASILLFRITYQTGNDYMHVTKAFGHVAVSQLPIQYLLAIKYPLSPITLATGLTHERLNAYHRLFGRLVHSLLATHAILYLRFFAVKNLLPKRLQDWDARLGTMAFWSANFLGLLAIPSIRAKVYHKVFYRSHVILSGLLLVAVWFHVPYTRFYVGQAAVFWILNGILRKGTSQNAEAKCELVSGNLIRVKAIIKESNLHPYLPGVHVYLNKPGLGPRTPFTVVSARALENKETEIELVAKNSGGPMTSFLSEVAKSGKGVHLNLEGPYGEAQTYLPEMLKYENAKCGKLLIVAGGVGATYALPIYKALTSARGSTSDTQLLWIVRNEQEMKWARGFLTSPSITPGIRIAVTQPEKPEDLGRDSLTSMVWIMNKGRPNLEDFVDKFLGGEEEGQHEHEPFTVMVCGPSGLSASLRTAVGKHVLIAGRDVRWYEEVFGFGGS